MARPDDIVPDLGFIEESGLSSPTWGPSISAATLQDRDPHFDGIFGVTTPPSDLRQILNPTGSATLTPSTTLVETSREELRSRERVLETLVTLLLEQLNSPSRGNFCVLEGMYSAYVDGRSPSASNPQRARGLLEDAICGLEAVRSGLWDVVKEPSEVAPERLRSLRSWAHAILLKDDCYTSSQPMPGRTMAPLLPIPQQPVPAYTVFDSNNFSPEETPSSPYTNLDANAFRSTQFYSPYPGNIITNLETHPGLDRAETNDASNYINPREVHPGPGGPMAAAGYMPFTPLEPIDRSLYGRESSDKRNNTTDSAYGTGE
ncbi:hypothetical protein LTR37_001323 [Vermiconidia calcicola]|uniref:Uncharacterized protein n=1 Tax=Vermiconidia calcicola TaxID=1690605 RepID=A0ACC3NWQ5_9PEZI|nr:hypothetical protein LTR37_001323 [Vermiconidia calcicola]